MLVVGTRRDESGSERFKDFLICWYKKFYSFEYLQLLEIQCVSTDYVTQAVHIVEFPLLDSPQITVFWPQTNNEKFQSLTFSMILVSVWSEITLCCWKFDLAIWNNSSNEYPGASGSFPWWCKPVLTGISSLYGRRFPLKSKRGVALSYRKINCILITNQWELNILFCFINPVFNSKTKTVDCKNTI